MKSINYFNQFPQGEAFVAEFGDYDADKLPAIDQAALVMVLGAFCYHQVALSDPEIPQSIHALSSLQELAAEHVPTKFDFTTDAIGRAIEILEGINIDQAIGLIAFLSQ